MGQIVLLAGGKSAQNRLLKRDVTRALHFKKINTCISDVLKSQCYIKLLA